MLTDKMQQYSYPLLSNWYSAV